MSTVDEGSESNRIAAVLVECTPEEGEEWDNSTPEQTLEALAQSLGPTPLPRRSMLAAFDIMYADAVVDLYRAVEEVEGRPTP